MFPRGDIRAWVHDTSDEVEVVDSTPLPLHALIQIEDADEWLYRVGVRLDGGAYVLEQLAIRHVHGKQITGSMLGKVSVADLQTMADAAIRSKVRGSFGWLDVPPQKPVRRRADVTEDDLRRVADLMRRADGEGMSRYEMVRRELLCSKRTAYRRMQEAKSKHYFVEEGQS